MNILVDADACPVVIRDILYRAAQKRQIALTLFANQSFHIPQSNFITLYQVAQGPDVADHEISRRVVAGDLVITADIPLAYEVLQQDAHVMTPRGERYTANTIRQRLQMRDFMETMRAAGQHSGGGAAAVSGRSKTICRSTGSIVTTWVAQAVTLSLPTAHYGALRWPPIQ